MGEQMRAYRIGMLKQLDKILSARADAEGREYHAPTVFEIHGLADLSMRLCPERQKFADWKEYRSRSCKEFPTQQQFMEQMNPQTAIDHLARLKALSQGRSVSTQKHAAQQYENNGRPKA